MSEIDWSTYGMVDEPAWDGATLSGPSNWDLLQESLGAAFDESPSWVPSDFFGVTTAQMPTWDGGYGGSYGSGSVGGFNTLNSGAGNMTVAQPLSLGDRVSEGASKLKELSGFTNKDITQMGLGLIGGIVQGKNQKERDAAIIAARAKEKQIDADAEKEKNAAFSASITGLPAQGLVGKQAQLKRTDGSNVYTNGKIARY